VQDERFKISQWRKAGTGLGLAVFLLAIQESRSWTQQDSGMTISPFNPDARLLVAMWPLFIAAAALAIGLALRRLIDRFLAEDDPRRFYIAQVLLYGGTFIVIATSVWLRHR
jgi:hypothetical protein